MTMLRLLKRVAFIGTLLCATVMFPQRSLASEEDEPIQQPYFYIKEKSPERCFAVTVGRQLRKEGPLGKSSFHVHYDLRADEENAPNAAVSLELFALSDVTNPKKPRHIVGKPKRIKPGKGSHDFPTKEAGTYSLCATSQYSTQERGLKLFLEFNIGPQDKKLEKLKKNYQLTDVQVDMLKLKRNAQHMLMKADYIKEMEVDYHKTLLRLNREVAFWPVVQVLILVGTGFYQVRHLKQFFKAKRLV